MTDSIRFAASGPLAGKSEEYENKNIDTSLVGR